MSEDKFVSVIIPTYKRASIVTTAIGSVQRQTHSNLEILVVDDGSPDNTESVVRSISDPRIRYLRHVNNKGLPAARNTGIKASKGEYIAFLDDDDQWKRRKLTRQLEALKNFDAVLCMGVSNGYPMRVHNRSSITLDDLRRGSFNPSSLVAKANVLKAVMFDEKLRQGEDWDGFIRIAQQFSLGWVPEPLLLYNQNSFDRMTDEKKNLTGAELEARSIMLFKHKEFFGEKWFAYHLAGALLTYIGSRRNKWQALAYAINKCGARSVIQNIRGRAFTRIQRAYWYAKWKVTASNVSAPD